MFSTSYLHRGLRPCMLVACFVFQILLSVVGYAANERPNVLVILTDDQGWGDLSLHGNPNLSTPNIDSLARDGAEVDNFYVCAVCSPTRAEFLTGRYHTRMGVYSTSTGGERFNADEQTIGDVFRGGGYATAAYGKWHSGMQYPYHPNARGFDDYYGFCSGHWGHYYDPMLEHNGKIVKGRGFLVDDLTDHVIEFMSAKRDKPFFVYLPLNTPHSPMQVPDRYWDKFKDKEIVPDPVAANAKKQNLIHTRAALAMCENIDDNVGRLLKHLDDAELADNTIVVYFCDNGPNGSRFNGGLRGRKGSTHEGGLRSPCLIRYPAAIKPGTRVTRIAGAVDLLPTLAEFAGITLKSPKPLDGISIAPLLRGAKVQWPDRYLFSAWNGKTTVRSGRFRLQGTGEFYDVQNDPREQIDVARKYPDELVALKQKLDAWVAETKPAKSRGSGTKRPITMAHPNAIWTQLPARDANPHGSIVRSNRFPNCTFMTEWKDTDSEITWDVEVLSAGEYEVEMYYACPKSSVDTKLQLSIGEEKLITTVTEANDSELIGMKEDRFERAEGYVRDWRPMKLGTLRLEPGRATLTLKALEIPGEIAVDMRLLMFRRR